ncbi:SDR family oxidoreductase [Curtobacterium caseinilyticum]|uniref:NAD(P)H-binding protein n=1 Tax=Curtobacterium caseinilyticum TaxID=3055137 RepID=A0ABT7TTS8_9MICO|nr:NAD(P)H-binding protein [Curtobacterium caseinilyticum]MDM7892229.1 NAD(P)H-binding protein [Curtobacterium caseinilyticum]
MHTPDIKPTLVMGARGSVGRHVLDALLAQGVPVRASARKPEPGRFPAGVDVVTADLTDRPSLDAAFAGIGQVFLYANHDGVAGVIDAARNAGVSRIVLMSSGSVIHPTSRGNAITEEHREVEDAFAAADDLDVVPIRPLVLATNALGWSWPIKATSSVALYQPDALTAPIHEKDIAAVTVAALTGTTLPAVSNLLTGPARISQREQVAAIAAATGKSIEVTELDRAAASAQFARFMPAEEAEAVLQFLDDAAAGNSPATTTIANVLGRPAIGFDEWAADHASDF